MVGEEGKGRTRVGDSLDLRESLPLHSLAVCNRFYWLPPRSAQGGKKTKKEMARQGEGILGLSPMRMSWPNNGGKLAREVFPSPPVLPEKYAPFH